MKLQFLTPPNIKGTLKATIHLTGKLGFSQGAIEDMNISENMFVKLAVNLDDESELNMYMEVTKEEDVNTLKINKAGNYYYVNTKLLFDKMGIDYRKKKVIFDITEIEYEGIKIYKLIRRDKDRKKSK